MPEEAGKLLDLNAFYGEKSEKGCTLLITGGLGKLLSKVSDVDELIAVQVH